MIKKNILHFHCVMQFSVTSCKYFNTVSILCCCYLSKISSFHKKTNANGTFVLCGHCKSGTNIHSCVWNNHGTLVITLLLWDKMKYFIDKNQFTLFIQLNKHLLWINPCLFFSIYWPRILVFTKCRLNIWIPYSLSYFFCKMICDLIIERSNFGSKKHNYFKWNWAP